jgi:hypothetical protein
MLINIGTLVDFCITIADSTILMDSRAKGHNRINYVMHERRGSDDLSWIESSTFCIPVRYIRYQLIYEKCQKVGEIYKRKYQHKTYIVYAIL